MAPPRATKKSRTASASRQSHKACLDEGDDDCTETDAMDVDDEAEDNELDPSQGTAFQKLITQSLNDQKKRHAVNKRKVKEEYNAAKTDLQKDINTLFDEYEDQSDAAHRAQLTLLADLLTLKASLESQMASKLTSLLAAYDAHSKELTAVLDSRVRDLK